MELLARGEYRRKAPSFRVPETDLPIRENVSPGTWFARDNVYNFIKFCRFLEVMEVVMFETEDLVSQKNEKHVILTLLEVARKGAKLGMLAPMLVQFEQEIDQELARRAGRAKAERIKIWADGVREPTGRKAALYARAADNSAVSFVL